MNNDNTTRSAFLVEETTLETAKAKLDHGELSEELRATVERIAHGADVAEETRLKDRLTELREDRRELTNKREQIEDDLEEKNRKIERVEERLDTLREQDGEYDGMLSAMEADLADGVRIRPDSKKVNEAASLAGCDPREVIADLKERNPDVPDKAFRAPKPDEDAKWKQPGGIRR